MNTTSADSVPASPAEDKFRALDDEGLNKSGVPRPALTVQRSPLFETADVLGTASRDLRLYVAAFEAFRNGWDDCDLLCEELRETGSHYEYWLKVSKWMERTSPARLRPVSDDEKWPSQVAAEVARFAEAHATAKEKVDISLAQVGGWAETRLEADELRTLWERLRGDGRAMRDAMADGLRTAAQRADHLAEVVRRCVETLRVLLPDESTIVPINSDMPSQTKLAQANRQDSLDDQSTTRKDPAPASAADNGTLT